MDPNLQRLTRELRKENCPQDVLDEVIRRIAAQAPPPARFRYGMAAILGSLALLCGIMIWRWPADHHAQPGAQLAATAAVNDGRVAEQAQVALGYIGRILLDAGAHSERVILNEAVKPLRNSLETARNKTINRI